MTPTSAANPVVRTLPAPPGPAGRVAVRAGGLLATVLLLAAVWLPLRPPVSCLLRAATGVPCPFCGGTTAMIELGRGRPLAALGASPLAALGAPLWVAWPLLRDRVAQWARRAGGRSVAAVVVLGLTASWLWQLERVLG